jgi:hypothetical protein
VVEGPAVFTRKAALAGLDSCYDYMLWFRPVCWEKNYVSKKVVTSTGGLRGRSGNLNLCRKRPACARLHMVEARDDLRDLSTQLSGLKR